MSALHPASKHLFRIYDMYNTTYTKGIDIRSPSWSTKHTVRMHHLHNLSSRWKIHVFHVSPTKVTYSHAVRMTRCFARNATFYHLSTCNTHSIAVSKPASHIYKTVRGQSEIENMHVHQNLNAQWKQHGPCRKKQKL